VGWSMADHMRTELVLDALQMALEHRRPEPGLVHHSDQGSQPGLNRSSQQLSVGVNLSTADDVWHSRRHRGRREPLTRLSSRRLAR